jgi:hypothetical protein
MTTNPHFADVPSWTAAHAMLTFRPLELTPKAHRHAAIRIHILDHKMRELPPEQRTLEARYDGFNFSQSRRGVAEAERLALRTSYGAVGHDARIGGRDARIYELGPEPPPDDVDGRSPSVVAWCDAEMFYLLSSLELPASALLDIAMSLYPPKGTTKGTRPRRR